MNGVPKVYDVDPSDEDTLPEREQESGVRAFGGVGGFFAGVVAELEEAFAEQCEEFEGFRARRRSSW